MSTMPHSAPATLAAAPTAHCAYRLRPGRRLRRASARRQCRSPSSRDARGLIDATRCRRSPARPTLARPPSSFPARPRSSANAASRSASSPPKKSFRSPAILLSAPRAGSIGTIQSFAAQSRSRSTSASVPSPSASRRRSHGEQGVFGTMQQNDPVFGDSDAGSRRACAAALGLSSTISILISPFRPSPPACLLHRSTQLARRRRSVCRFRQQAARAYLERIGAKFFHCITRADADSESATGTHACSSTTEKILPPDRPPAAPSACLCGMDSQQVDRPIVIEQGIEMLRPSRHSRQRKLAGDVVTEVFVGGRTIPVATGRFFLP